MPTTLQSMLRLAAAGLLCSAPIALGQTDSPSVPGTPVKATLTTGEILDGTLKERKGDGLVNFTPATVTVRRGSSLLVYGENGSLMARLYRAPA